MMNENTHNQAGQQPVKTFGFKPSDLLNLDKFIAPSILLVLYWIVMVGVILFGLVTLAGGVVGLFQSFLRGVMGITIAVVLLVILPLYVRVLFETLVVFFNINNHLSSIRENTTPRANTVHIKHKMCYNSPPRVLSGDGLWREPETHYQPRSILPI